MSWFGPSAAEANREAVREARRGTLRMQRSLRAAHAGLAAYFRFYNTERPHQSLANQTPADVYDNSQPLQRAA